MTSNKKINNLKPFINQFIMKYIPEGFQDKSKIENWLIIEKNQEILENFLEEKNIEEGKLFDALLAGSGQYYLRSSEWNLTSERFSLFKTVFNINEKLNQIQEELDGNPDPIEYSNIWLFGVRNNINHYISTTGIGLYLSFETELKVSDYYDSLFKSMVPVPALPDENITQEDIKIYFNSKPRFNDKIEEKVHIDMQSKFYQIMSDVLKNKVETIIQTDFVFVSKQEDDEMGVDFDVVLSNENIAKKISIENFFDDVDSLIANYSPELSIKEMCNDIVNETNQQLKQEFNACYEKYKNNPNLEPLNKHKKPIKIKFD